MSFLKKNKPKTDDNAFRGGTRRSPDSILEDSISEIRLKGEQRDTCFGRLCYIKNEGLPEITLDTADGGKTIVRNQKFGDDLSLRTIHL